MFSKKITFSLLVLPFILWTSCGQNAVAKKETVATVETAQIEASKPKPPHRYGGWYCPDNILGFPAVDVQELDLVPVVNGRLPTKEETKNGVSLLYIDSTHTPSARPLEMTMPRLARYYSQETEKNELVVVIQALLIEEDTVVGFRNLNGGNGSAWFDEITFLSAEEIDKLGSTPFVASSTTINASPEDVWEIITNSAYAKSLGEMFDKNVFIESDWRKNSNVYFKYAPDKTVTTGILTAVWKDSYIQIDYDLDGYHYVEKFLLLENETQDGTDLYITSGPYSEDFEDQKVVWNNWLQKVKELSEAE